MSTTQAPSAAKMVEELRRRILSGAVREGQYISSVRSLSQEFGCAPLTAHRALRQLAQTGLVVAEPRHGYRVTSPGAAVKAHETIVSIEDTTGYEGYIGDIHETQMAAIRRGALARGWASASLPYSGQPVEEIGRQLHEMGATAIIIQDVGERFPRGLVNELVALGLPTIGLDMNAVVPRMDQVLRDESHGAALAVNHLVAQGHRRIGWYGPMQESSNALRRYAGAAEALLAAGLQEEIVNWRSISKPTETATARAYLERPDRPKAVLALWQTAALALARAARELGLRLGRDLDLVGWALEEHYDNNYTQDCPELSALCATVTWSMTDVSRVLLNQIETRRRNPDLPGAGILLPMKLRQPANPAR